MLLPTNPTIVVAGASGGLGAALLTACAERWPGSTRIGLSRSGAAPGVALALQADVTDLASLRDAAGTVAADAGPVHLLLNATGLLHDGDLQPEKSISDVTATAFARLFSVHAGGLALLASAFRDGLRHREGSVLASLSARVGSIGDNRLGGWHAYRASKAAHNMVLKNLAIELGRPPWRTCCVALHPGTVATDLSAPFRGSVQHEVFDPPAAAAALLDVVAGLDGDSNGAFLDWRGKAIPW